jgi:polysaccharide export outer membrane protein
MIDLSLCRLRQCLGSLLIGLFLLAGLTLQPARAQQPSSAEAARDDYVLGPGDAIRIQVFQNPDLTVEARVSEAGVISYPLLGAVRIGGMSPTNVEKLISQRLRDGKFLQNPQVTVNITTFRSQQVSVLGNVTRPGRYPIETTGMRLSEVLSLAGGVAATGADDVVLVTSRGGKPIRLEIDLVDMFASGDLSKDPQMQAGDVVYVNRAPQYYIYGQVQRPGQYGVDRGLTLAQAIAKGGGLTLRGTDKAVRVHRRYGNKQIQILEPKLDDPIRPDDLIFVRESVF